MSPDGLRQLVPDVARRDVYLCGPPGLVRAVGAGAAPGRRAPPADPPGHRSSCRKASHASRVARDHRTGRQHHRACGAQGRAGHHPGRPEPAHRAAGQPDPRRAADPSAGVGVDPSGAAPKPSGTADAPTSPEPTKSTRPPVGHGDHREGPERAQDHHQGAPADHPRGSPARRWTRPKTTAYVQVQITVSGTKIIDAIALELPQRRRVRHPQRATCTTRYSGTGRARWCSQAERQPRHRLRRHRHQQRLQAVAAGRDRPGVADVPRRVTRPGLRRVEQIMGTAISLDLADDLPAGTPARAGRRRLRLDARGRRPVQHLPGRQRGVPASTGASCRCPRRRRTCGPCWSAAPTCGAPPTASSTRTPPAGWTRPAYVKGWAAQVASDRLLAAGATNHCVNAGGDVRVRGLSPPGEPWRIGVRHPWDADGDLPGARRHRPGGRHLRGLRAGPPRAATRAGARPAGGLRSVTVVGARPGRGRRLRHGRRGDGRRRHRLAGPAPRHLHAVVTDDGRLLHSTALPTDPVRAPPALRACHGT